jgi:branched-chain amino acid transport system substrate-binding protein
LLPGIARSEVFGSGDATIKIAMLEDFSGPYRDLTGPVGLTCARQAVNEFVATNPGFKVELISADHQNKADVASGIVREWFDRGNVDALLGVGNTAIAIAVDTLVEQQDKVNLCTTAASADLTGPNCSPNMVHWTFDTWCTSHATVPHLLEQGKKSWFIIRADYSFGKTLQAQTTGFVEAAGGKVVGSVAFPFPGTEDFSSFLLQGQASGAQVIAFATAGNDTINCIKQAQEFGLEDKATLVGLSSFVSDAISLGPQAAKGLVLASTFYWDLNDRTRAFTKRVRAQIPAEVVPNRNHAGDYSALTHYLKVVRSMGPANARGGRAVIAAMKAMPTDDDAFGAGMIRADGRKIHPVYLFQAKGPNEIKGPGDVLKVIATIPADQAFRPMSEGGCKMVKA